MKTTKLVATLLVAGVLFTGCGLKGHKAAIKINNSVITEKQFEEALDKQIAQSPMAQMGDLKSNKDGMLYLMVKQQVVNRLIIEELLNQEANNRGIKVSNKEVDEAIAKIINKFGGKDKLTEILNQNGMSVSEFKKDIKNQVRMHKLAQEAGKIKITDADVKKFYDDNADKFKHGEQVRASHILIMANPYQISQDIAAKSKQSFTEEKMKEEVEKVIEQKKAEAEKIAKELQADKSKFAAYAKKYSEDEMSAQNGGDLGFFEKERMVPEFANYAFSAKPNTVSEPVQSQYGYHIIMVTDRAAAGTVAFDEVKSNIKEYLTQDKEIEALDKITRVAKKKAKIEYLNNEYNPAAISKKLTDQMGDLKKEVQAPVTNSKKK